MIDPSKEAPILLRDIFDIPWLRDLLKAMAKTKPSTKGQRPWKKPDVSTPYRWHRIGMRGVRLEIIHIAGQICTSEAALKRFFQNVTAAAEQHRDAAEDEKYGDGVEAAESALEAAGV